MNKNLNKSSQKAFRINKSNNIKTITKNRVETATAISMACQYSIPIGKIQCPEKIYFRSSHLPQHFHYLQDMQLPS